MRDAFQFVVDLFVIQINLPGPAGTQGPITILAIMSTFAIIYALVYLGLSNVTAFDSYEKGRLVIAVSIGLSSAFLTPAPAFLGMLLDGLAMIFGVATSFIIVILLLLLLFLGPRIFGSGIAKMGSWANEDTSNWNRSSIDRIQSEDERDAAKANAKQNALQRDQEVASAEEKWGRPGWFMRKLGGIVGIQTQAMNDLRNIKLPTTQDLQQVRKYLQALQKHIGKLSNVGQSGGGEDGRGHSEQLRDMIANKIAALVEYFSDNLRKVEEIETLRSRLQSAIGREWAIDQAETADFRAIIRRELDTHPGMDTTRINDAIASGEGIDKKLRAVQEKVEKLNADIAHWNRTLTRYVDPLEALNETVVNNLNDIRSDLIDGRGDYRESYRLITDIVRQLDTYNAYVAEIEEAITFVGKTLDKDLKSIRSGFTALANKVIKWIKDNPVTTSTTVSSA